MSQVISSHYANSFSPSTRLSSYALERGSSRAQANMIQTPDQSGFEDGTIIQERVSRGTLRKVLYSNAKIYKYFTTIKWPGDLRKPWRLEANALRYLPQKGIDCPKLLSLSEENRRVVLCKEYVAGEPLSEVSLDNVKHLAKTLAKINAAGVFTCDPHVGNFLKVASDKFTFIDFGRSRVIRTRFLFFLFYLGKEKARITHLLLSGAEEHLKEIFWKTYTESLGIVRDPVNISKFSERYWLKRVAY